MHAAPGVLLLDGRRLDLGQGVGVKERGDAKQRARGLDAGRLQPGAERLRGGEERVDVRRVVVQPDDMGE